MKFTIIYNKNHHSDQHTVICDDEALAQAVVLHLQDQQYELVFYPQWDSNGVFTSHKS